MTRTARIMFTVLLLSCTNLFGQSADALDACVARSGEDATYLKDFPVQLAATTSTGRPPVARFPLVLSSNNIYRFTICTSEGSEGKAVLKLYDSNRLIFSSYKEDTEEEFNPFNFLCRKTGIYHVFISFLDGQPGKAVGVLSYVNKK